MRRYIDEISRPESRTQADIVLRNAGYENIGSGNFANLYRKDNRPYVLKIFVTQDDAYRAFIALVQAHPNKHFPKFIGKVVKVTPSYYAIRTEFLSVYRNDPTLIFRYMRYRDHFRSVPVNPNSHTYLGFLDACDLMEEMPELQEACDLIIDNLLGRYELDIKPENLMVRDRTLVLTDPIKN